MIGPTGEGSGKLVMMLGYVDWNGGFAGAAVDLQSTRSA